MDATRTPSAGVTAARSRLNRLKGPGLLALLAILGLGLAALGMVPSPQPDVAILRGDRGITIILSLDPSDGLAVFQPPAVRMVLSQLPIALDAGRSVIRIDGGSVMLLPPRWVTTILDRHGRLTHLDREIDPHRAQALVLEKSFEGVRKILIDWEPRLEEFFKD
jgi:hypothetical protein